MAQQRNNAGFSFIGMVVGVMTLLKIRDKYDDYKRTAGDEEGRVALNSPSTENLNGGIALPMLDTEIPASMRRPKKKAGSCICCGMDCTLFWKAVGIVLGLFTLYYAFKAIKWALTDAPTGLEGMPAFGTSLGCSDAPHIYNGSEVTIMIPIAPSTESSAFDIRGGGVGTILIADGAANATQIKYKMTLRATDEDLLKDVNLAYPEADDTGTISRSRFIVDTPTPSAGHCIRYDVTVFLPPTLRKMHVQARTLAHVSFAPGTAAAAVDNLLVTLYALNPRNILLASASIVPKYQQLEAYSGYVVGEAAIADQLELHTQRGDAVANVKIMPALPLDPEHPTPAYLRTTSGSGRSDFTYLGSKAFSRNIKASHIASKNADMYLTYRGADVNGKVQLNSRSYTLTGAQSFKSIGEETGDWTHFVGDKDGGDEIRTLSRGWTGLYF